MLLGSRVGWIVGVDGELVDGELDIAVHGGLEGPPVFMEESSIMRSKSGGLILLLLNV